MPRKLEEALKRSAVQHGFKPGSERYDRYVYGGLRVYEQSRQQQTERSEAARKLSGGKNHE